MRDKDWTSIFDMEGKLRPMTSEELASLPPQMNGFWWAYERPCGRILFLTTEEALFYVAYLSSQLTLKSSLEGSS